jgi:hypothetical protein
MGWLRALHELLRRLMPANARSVRPALRSEPWSRPSADARANWLLRYLLNASQREQFERFRCFLVEVPGRGTFAVLPQLAFSVVNVASGESYCVMSETPVPIGDHMLIQKLLLENDAERFFSVARRRTDPVPLDRRLVRLLTAPQRSRRSRATL